MSITVITLLHFFFWEQGTKGVNSEAYKTKHKKNVRCEESHQSHRPKLILLLNLSDKLMEVIDDTTPPFNEYSVGFIVASLVSLVMMMMMMVIVTRNDSLVATLVVVVVVVVIIVTRNDSLVASLVVVVVVVVIIITRNDSLVATLVTLVVMVVVVIVITRNDSLVATLVTLVVMVVVVIILTRNDGLVATLVVVVVVVVSFVTNKCSLVRGSESESSHNTGKNKSRDDFQLHIVCLVRLNEH
jgi:hypothetical protein